MHNCLMACPASAIKEGPSSDAPKSEAENKPAWSTALDRQDLQSVPCFALCQGKRCLCACGRMSAASFLSMTISVRLIPNNLTVGPGCTCASCCASIPPPSEHVSELPAPPRPLGSSVILHRLHLHCLQPAAAAAVGKVLHPLAGTQPRGQSVTATWKVRHKSEQIQRYV